MNLLKGKKPTYEEISPLYPEARKLTQELISRAYAGLGRLGEPYGGELVAQTYVPEERALLEEYLRRPYSTETSLYKIPREEIEKIVRGEYLTTPSPVYEALRKTMLEEEYPELASRLRQALAMRGTFYSSAAEKGERELLEDIGRRLTEARAEELAQERERQVAMLPTAMRLAEVETEEPATRLARVMSLADYLRQIEQAQLEARYREWLRQREEELGTPLELAQVSAGLAEYYPYYRYIPGKASPFAQYIAPAVLGGLGAYLGGGGLWGTLGGAALGGLGGYQGATLPWIYSMPWNI